MDRRRRNVFGVFLVVAGAAFGVLFRAPLSAAGRSVFRTLFPASREAEREAQIRSDARTLLDIVRPDPRLPATLTDQPEFWAAWDKRRVDYSSEDLADLRRRLLHYLEFLQAEHEDCADIYRSGLLDTVKSDAAVAARAALRADFGDFALVLIAQADKLRDDAYKASPKTAGYDPEADNFLQVRDDLRAWLPRATLRVDELTAPLK